MNQDDTQANNIYKQVLQGKKTNFCPFRKEFQMEVLERFLGKDFQDRTGLNVLDACCGQGRLLYYLQKFNDRQKYLGFDYVADFVADANTLFETDANIVCEHADIFNLPQSYNKRFDITLLYKTLAWLPNYKNVLQALFFATKNKIYITSPMYVGDVDFEIKIKMHTVHRDGEYGFYYIYGMPQFEAYCFELGARSVVFHDMVLPFDLPVSSNPDIPETYTVRTATGDNIELTGVIKLDWKLVVIEL